MQIELLKFPYSYMEYEKLLQRRELDVLLPTAEVLSDTKCSTVISGDSINLSLIKELTFYRAFQIDDSIFPTRQGLYEEDNTLQVTKQHTRYSTHGLHEYKGKFNPQIVHAIANIFGVQKGQKILDPFNGSGTTIEEALDYLNIQHKQDTTQDDAYSVLTGSLVYAFKTFMEVVEHDLANTLIGRQSTRIIIEIYIMMKYLCDKEAEKPTIWSEYKAYGIGKYKLILLKMREGMGSDTNHVSEKMLDMLVNEPQLEEFTDVDLRYFDDVKIRDKAISVGEKDLYDVAYDYDSSYAHGLWGAVRESCMLVCDNVFHHFRPVADASLSQNLPDITEDCFNYLVRLILLVNERYSFPEWYIASLEKHHE